jgi:hypothetical protein
MANSSTSLGQTQRAGVKRLITDKQSAREAKKRKKLKASKRVHIQESSYGTSFTEKGKDENQAQPGGKAVKGRIYQVTIITEGLGNSKDKNFYSPEALQSGAQLFNSAKAYADHPDAISEKTLPERSMKDLVGWYSDCVASKSQDGKVQITGQLHMFPDAKWLSDKIDMILTQPTAQKLFGISINAIGKTRPSQMNAKKSIM